MITKNKVILFLLGFSVTKGLMQLFLNHNHEMGFLWLGLGAITLYFVTKRYNQEVQEKNKNKIRGTEIYNE